MNHLHDIQKWLRSSDLSGVIVPSTDEFLSEFPPAWNRRLRWATGFRGSVGLAVILRDTAALFLDGRYQLQGSSDCRDAPLAVRPNSIASQREWLRQSLPPRARLGLNAWWHSGLDLVQWRGLGRELGFEVELLAEHPVDRLWIGRPLVRQPRIVDYPAALAGDPYQDKCARLCEYVADTHLGALLVADPEDVSWLLNVRAEDETVRTEVGDWHVVPSCTTRALIRRDGVTWFVEPERLLGELAHCGREMVTIAPPELLIDALRSAALKGPIGLDQHRTPAALTAVLNEQRHDAIVARRRWLKRPAEILGARRAHTVDAVAVVRFMSWLARAIPERIVSEFEAAEVLEGFRREHADYKGASMPLMSASGPSGAMPHYVPRREGCRRVNDHPIYWMDSGGQYRGGTTDNTITLAVGAPEAKHVLAHTLVLKGFIALSTARVPDGIHALRLDAIARQALWREGLDFDHNTGHGVGNYLNIHEGPVIGRDPGPKTNVPMQAGMIMSNEPAYYAPGDFGIRIESHMTVIPSSRTRFIEFETISRLPIDPRLVDFDRLSGTERDWLTHYHRMVLQDLEPMLDQASAAWLGNVTRAFTEHSEAHPAR